MTRSLAAKINTAIQTRDISSIRDVFALNENQSKRWKTLLDQAGDAILTIEPESGVFLDYNHRALEIFEVEESSFGALSVSDLTPPEDLPWVWRQLRRIITEGQLTIPEVPVLTGTGKRIYCDITASIVQLEDSLLIQGIFRDVTDRITFQESERKQRESLQEKTKALEESRRVISDFLATISHELRTPLNAIVGFNSLLEDGLYGELNQDQQRATQKIDANASQLLALIDQLLQMSKLEAGEIGVTVSRFDVTEAIRTAIEPYRAAYRDKAIALEFDPHPTHVTLQTDEEKLKEIIRQLVMNALHATERGSVQVDIGVDESDFILSITDTGHGIPESHLERIFEIFQKEDRTSSRRSPGAGVGLCIVRHLSRLLGGRVEVQSIVGQGSTFQLILPETVWKASSPVTLHGTGSAPKEETERIPYEATLDILIVADDPYLVEILAAALERNGQCRVRRAYSGMEAMLKLTERQPNLVLIDLVAPHINGSRIVEFGSECWGEKSFTTVALCDKDNASETDRTAMRLIADTILPTDDLHPNTILGFLEPYLKTTAPGND